MAVFKCKMCGGTLDVHEGMTVCECEYCGSKQTVPQLDDEKKINLFSRANRLRSVCEFDKAYGVYETIISDFPEEAEAYWGLLLCKYGIEYVDDPKTGRKIPTCHRSSFDSIMDDQDFDMVMEYSDPASRAVYREEAKVIEGLRVGINEVSSKEEPYDIFICYKETDAMGERTLDSVIAQDVYDALIEKGYKVFFSRITLEDKLGQEYEPYIFAALNSAKVMLVFGTDYEYFNAVWVKNEWSRFLSLIAKGAKKTLIPCFKGVDAYDMPKEFARLQAQDMGKVGAIQDLLRGIGKIIGAQDPVLENGYNSSVNPEASTLVQRGNMALEDGDFKGAEGHFERALDLNPAEAQAYLGKFLATLGLSSLADLNDKVCMIDEYKEFRRAEQFADANMKIELQEVRNSNELKIERLRLLYILKKYKRVKGKEQSNAMLKYAYKQLFLGTMEGENNARDAYQTLLDADVISGYTYRKLNERIDIVKAIAVVLSDFEQHSESKINKEGTLHKFSAESKRFVLADLIKYDLIEKRANGYSLCGAREVKAAYTDACIEAERHIQEEVRLRAGDVLNGYDIRIKQLQQEIDKDIAERNKQREEVNHQISEWRSQQSALGFFKGKEKHALQVKIDDAQKELDSIPTQEQIQEKYQPAISKINAEKQAEVDKITAEVQMLYPLPKLEDFIS